VASIIRQIRRERVPAVFLENISDPRQMEQIARESGARVGGKVYSDALSAPGGPAATYLDLMRSNLKAFDAALMPG
jgi:zinc/manganese transport system substrate-binding protein